MKVGDKVEIVGLRDHARHASIGRRDTRCWVDEGRAGDIVGLLLPATPVEEIERGQVMALPENVKAHERFEAGVYMLGPEEGGRQTNVLSRYSEFQFRTARVRGDVTLPEGVETVLPGDVVSLSVELMAPVVMTKGSQFVIRKEARIVGAGTVSGAG